MPDLKLSLACWDYDRTRALIDGRVRPQGIELAVSTMFNVGEIMERMVRGRQYDVSELGITYYLRTLKFSGAPFIAIPVFPNRFFRHSAIFVNANADIAGPKDLVGKKVGELHRYGHDAGIWAKGALADDYGVKASSMAHYVGGMDRPVPQPDWAPFQPPPDVEIHQLSPAQNLNDMLERGEIDALFSAHVPPAFRSGSPKVRRLFADYETVERDYFQRTGIFPIMHTVVIRRDLYQNNRWIARALMQAFEEAKAIAAKAYAAADVFFQAPSMNPWMIALREKNRALMGDDFWPYGVAANRNTLQACLRYHHEQGITKRLYSVEELFAPETLS